MKSNIDPHPGHVNLKDNEVQANEQKNINDFSFKNRTSSLYKGVSNKKPRSRVYSSMELTINE